jgi:uncharacterized membrane protein
MATRIAAIFALLTFVFGLMVGLELDNTFRTTVLRATGAMVVTFFVGLVVGGLFDVALKDHLKVEEEKLKNSPPKSG